MRKSWLTLQTQSGNSNHHVDFDNCGSGMPLCTQRKKKIVLPLCGMQEVVGQTIIQKDIGLAPSHLVSDEVYDAEDNIHGLQRRQKNFCLLLR